MKAIIFLFTLLLTLQAPIHAGDYDHIDPSRKIDRSALKKALRYYDRNYGSLRNKDTITLIDMSLHSSKKKFFVIDVNSGRVKSYHTSHGSGSDRNHDGYADRFSNTPNSKMSSLGFYRTAETYHGKHGYSLRLDGLSSSNSKARSRAIVIHGADYISKSYIRSQKKTGRSWGCPALDLKYSRKVINDIKGGSLLYIFK
ncbi:MAG: murein L,D-transpeptidase catalytic domain family protein [Halobacteriovoraceae bacterium]|nr:murein L,D-transpeptidase catalytic domain family protein [Halobacteriovoraceae bacterium]